MPSRRRKPGPFSRDQALTDVDGRTRAGRVMRSVTSELMDHLGKATAPQRLLVQSIAVKAARLAMLLDGRRPGEGRDTRSLAWFNSLRADLEALGIERKQIASLKAYDSPQADTQTTAAA